METYECDMEMVVQFQGLGSQLEYGPTVFSVGAWG